MKKILLVTILVALIVSGCDRGPSTVPVTGVSLDLTSLELTEGDSAALQVTVSPDNATDASVVWNSSDESVARVSDDGLVEALAAGNASISVTTVDGGFSACCSLVVNPLIIYDIDSGTAPQAMPGWNIYDGQSNGTYRYGPSIIINEDGSVDMWTAAPGGTHSDGDQLWYANAASHAYQFGGQVFANYFVSDTPFVAVSVGCPSWTSPTECVRMTIYGWKGDYTSTVSSEALASVYHQNYKDNAQLAVCLDDEMTRSFPAGKYLVTLSEGTPNSGVWSTSKAYPVTHESVCYIGGQVTDKQFKTMIHYHKPLADPVFWDQIMYRRSTDGGKTWTEERAALVPDPAGEDHYSCCDPGVICFGGYYYIGYTSTERSTMDLNKVYLARSKNPDGPWERWNGSGWGGHPHFVIDFSGSSGQFGAGEPSMVVVDNTVYFYYSYCTGTRVVRVCTAPADDPLWPSKLEYKGVAMTQSVANGSDSADIKYCDRTGKFYAVFTYKRMTANSTVMIYSSADGLSFTQMGEIRGEKLGYLHNCGISGDAQGHFDPGRPQFISYAYGPSWGAWNTWISPLVW